MSVDLDAAETLQTGYKPDAQTTAGADSDLVDGAGRPLPPGAKFNPLGMVVDANMRPLKGFKQRKDLATAERGGWGKGKPKVQKVVADAPAEKPKPAAADEERPPSMTRTRAEKKLAMRWGQFWDLCAEGWDDDALRVTPDEEKEWAEPVAYVMEQMGWLHHTDKLDWVGAVAVTGKQAGPRVTRMVRNHPRGLNPHPDGQQPPPAFKRPAGMGARRGAPVGEPVRQEAPTNAPSGGASDTVVPFVQAEGAGNPLPLDPLFMPRPDGLE